MRYIKYFFKRYRYTLTILQLSFCFLSCKGQIKNVDQKVVESDSITRTIPLNGDGQPSYFYNLINDLSSKLRLNNITNGFDSLQIRIWSLPFNAENGCSILDIKNANSNWACSYHNFDKSRDSNNYIIINYDSIKKLYPKSSWSSFILSLYDLKINSLQGLDKSEADGNIYCIEIATKFEYKFYSITAPELYYKSDPQAKSLIQILDFIKKQLNY